MVAPDPSLLDAADIARGLQVDPAVGLTATEAAARLARDGPNELRGVPPVSVWHRLLSQFQDPLIYLLLVAVVVSTVAWFAEGARDVPVDAIVVLNGMLGFVQEARADSARHSAAEAHPHHLHFESGEPNFRALNTIGETIHADDLPENRANHD